MKIDPELEKLPGRQGEIGYFVHVHPHKRTRPVSAENGTSQIRMIEGKPRPVVIIGKVWWFDYSTISRKPIDEKPENSDCNYYTATARPGYLVVALRNDVPNGRENMHSKPIKDLVRKGKSSVISYLPVVYPEAAYRHGAFEDEKRALSSHWVGQIYLELNDRGLRGNIVDPQVISD